MNLGRTIAVSLALVLAAATSDSAFANDKRRGHGGNDARHGHGGNDARHGHQQHWHHHYRPRIVFHAVPVIVPRYYPAPVYYAPPPAPTAYVEQPRQGYWHYCPAFSAYYPQVQTCPGGWQLVAPQPR